MAEKLSRKRRANGNGSDVGIVPPETVLEARREISISKDALSQAQTDHRNVCKRWQGKGINTKALIEIILLRQKETETVIAHFRDVFRYGRIEKAAFAEQLNLFNAVKDTEPTGKAREEHAEFEAQEAGYIAGRRGFGQDANPHQPGSKMHPVWVKAWTRGQAHIAKQLGKNAKVATAAPRKKAPPPPATGSVAPRKRKAPAAALAAAREHLGSEETPTLPLN
jgi:hypothetical protein